MADECFYCGSPCSPFGNGLCADCNKCEESKSAEFDSYCEEFQDDGGDGYSEGGFGTDYIHAANDNDSWSGGNHY